MRRRRRKPSPARIISEHRSIEHKLRPLLEKDEPSERDKERIEALKEDRAGLEDELMNKLDWTEEEAKSLRGEEG